MNLRNASNGLMYAFVSILIYVFGTILSLFYGFFSKSFDEMIKIIVIIGIGSVIMNFFGIYLASKDDPGYKKAYIFTCINLVINIVLLLDGDQGLLQSLLNLAQMIFQIMIIYYICKTTSNLHTLKNNYTLAANGDRIWRLSKIMFIAYGICMVLMFIPFINILASIAMLAVSIMFIYIAIIYIIFLKRSSDAFLY